MKPSILRSVLALACLAAGATAQVVPVNNTGCPGYAPPQVQGTPRIGQTISFALQRRATPRSLVFVALGWSSGGGIAFQAPFTCVSGPCVWYLAPIGADYILVSDPLIATLTLPIPNDRRLLFSTFAVQGGFIEGLQNNCLTLSQAVSFAIGP